MSIEEPHAIIDHPAQEILCAFCCFRAARGFRATASERRYKRGGTPAVLSAYISRNGNSRTVKATRIFGLVEVPKLSAVVRMKAEASRMIYRVPTDIIVGKN